MEQVYTYGDAGRSPRGRVISVAYCTILPGGDELPMRAGDASWFTRNELPELAFDQQLIIDDAYLRIKDRFK